MENPAMGTRCAPIAHRMECPGMSCLVPSCCSHSSRFDGGLNESCRNPKTLSMTYVAFLSMALLSDNELDDREIAAMIETRIQDKMGITPDQFRSALHQLCEEILLDDGDKAGVAVTDPDQAIEMMVLINRDASMSFDDISQLVDLIYDTDSTVIKATLLDDKRIDETLDRIDNPQLQLWICGMLLYLIKADNVIHENEKSLF